MAWGKLELEPEVQKWALGLSEEERGRVQFYFDLLEEKGVLLDEPYTRQLRGKLRELRFYLGRERRRVTYFIAAGRRIPMLTVFRKTKRHEQREIDRAVKAMKSWLERETKGEGRK
jgi:phage-related protein